MVADVRSNLALCMLIESPQHMRSGRLAQLVARFLHTEEVVSSSLASPTAQPPVFRGLSRCVGSPASERAAQPGASGQRAMPTSREQNLLVEC